MDAPMEADYVVVGCGAVGMAFADTLVRHANATVIMVDRHHQPGGHWNHAYPFVRLHLPSHFYGCESLDLGDRSLFLAGHNRGLLHMASAAEINAYYQHVMERILLPTGRVTFLPMTDYQGDGVVGSRLTGDQRRLTARKKWVDATYTPSPVPATHTRSYDVAATVTCVPINDLPSAAGQGENYCVVGAGKTGMDACLWLLAHGVPAERIRWVMPRDAWWIDRALLQSSDEFFDALLGFMTAQMESLSEATSADEVFLGFERRGIAFRFDPTILPTMSHNATITRSELAELRRVKDVVRLGRVRAIEADRLILEKGSIPARPDCLYVDCSAAGLTTNPPVPVFTDSKITLQLVRLLRPCLSGSIIAYLEAKLASDDEKNAMAAPVPLPEVPADWLRMAAISAANQARASQRPEILKWLAGHRLDPGTALLARAANDPARRPAVERMRAMAAAGMAKLPELMAKLESHST
jgi:NAD(P)-binding Rossmann-like domain